MRHLLAVVTACVSAFFVFDTVRLYVVTGFLRTLRAGGHGAYIGAVVFPLIAIGFAVLTYRFWQRQDDDARHAD